MKQPQPATWMGGLLLAVCGVASAQSRVDTIIPEQGESFRGVIESTAPEGIKISAQGQTREVPFHEIRSVALSGEPSALRQAKTALSEQQFEAALQGLSRLNPDDLASERDLIRQEFDFVRATALTRLALAGNGDATAAARELLTFLRDHRTSFHFYPAFEMLGHLAMQLGKYDSAAKYYGQLSRAPASEVQLRGAVLEADALRGEGPNQRQAARVLYDKVLSQTSRSPAIDRLQTRSRVGLAMLTAEEGDPQASIEALYKMIAENNAEDEELFAQLYLALGDSCRLAGLTQDAILAYLHVDLLFYRQTAQHAAALYWLSQLWTEIGHPARANAARATLQSRYSQTVWATR